MSNEPDVDRAVTVSDGVVHVEKSFAGEEFPVPAIKFRLDSESDEPVHVRLVDQIPEDFPMEGVGFHPDYESDNWTAYKDHRVEYERTLDPGETTTTVYGIRLEDTDGVEGFLSEPILERPPVPGESHDVDGDSDVEDILGDDRSQLVRDALQGNGRLANGPDADPTPAAVDGESESAALAADEPDASAVEEDVPGGSAADGSDEPIGTEAADPRELDADLTPAMRRRDDAEGVDDLGDSDGSEDAEDVAVPADADVAAAVEANEPALDEDDAVEDRGATDESEEPEAIDVPEEPESIDVSEEPATGASEEPVESEESVDDYVDVGDYADDDGRGRTPSPESADGGLAATLAAEIRAGEVSESDLETLRGELDAGLPRSADVRLRRVQAQVEDLNAYADAIAEFIDEEGTGAELVERLDAEFAEIRDEFDDLRSEVDAAGSDREEIRGDVSGLRSDVEGLGERAAAVEERLDEADERIESTDERVGRVEADADDLAETVEGVSEDVDAVTATVDDVAADLDDVAAEVESVAADVDETDARVAQLDDEMGEVREDIAALDGDVLDVRESIEARVDDLRGEVSALADELDRIESIEREIEELQTFRHRLNDAFGPAGE